MAKSKLEIFQPLAPAPETLADPQFTIRDESKTRLICYCPVSRAGAVYTLDPGIWAIYVPIDLASFIGSLRDRGIVLPDGEDLQTWLTAVSSDASRQAHAH